MRTRHIQLHPFFEELKKTQLPSEEPFQLVLSGDRGTLLNETRASAPKNKIQPGPPLFRIRKDPESLNDLRGHNAIGTFAKNPQPQLNRPLDPSVLLVPLIGLGKESDGQGPLRGTVQIGLLIVGLCTVIALMIGYFQARRTIISEPVSSRLDSAGKPQTEQIVL